MPSNPLLGKFGPIILLAVVQLVLVVAAPSTGAPTNAALGSGATPYTQNGAAGTGGQGGVAGVPGGSAGGAAGVPGAPGAAAGGTTGGATGGANVGTGTAPKSGGGVTQASGSALQKLPGDRSHCVGGRQFSTSIDFYAPQCVPGKPGAPYPNNGGGTWQGVSNNQIEVVNYVADYGAEVDQILKAQGLYYNADDAKVWNKAYQDFMNSHYQLWGRKIHIDTVQGNCQTVPPNYQCLIGDMDRIVSKYHPYAVFWETTVCSVCYAELSRLHVVNFGGSGFSDAFHNQNAPYSYDAGMSSSRVELEFADWWCHQMNGRNAIFAGKQNPAQNFRNTKRQLGVISTNDPDNENTVKQVLYPALKKGCGASVNGHEYFYAQDINTATQQSQAAEAAMNTPSNPATSVLCLCDPVAPQFGFNAYATDNYWPESILATDQTMDFDSNGQTYSSGDHKNDNLSCPNPRQGCQFDNAVGLGSAVPQVKPDNMAAVKIWRMQSGQNSLPKDGQPPALSIVWDNWSMFATLVQNSGPVLTPQRMQSAATQLTPIGGGRTGMPLRAFHNNDWCWTQDVRVIYWDTNKTSPYNGVKGTFVSIEGKRFNLGEFPTMSQPPAPEPEDRK